MIVTTIMITVIVIIVDKVLDWGRGVEPVGQVFEDFYFRGHTARPQPQ